MATGTEQTTAAGKTQAHLWRRLAAMVYDGLLLLALNFLVAFVLIRLLTPTSAALHQSLFVLPDTVRHLILLPAILLTTALFYSFFWVRNQQTLGMQTWHIRVESIEGKPLGWLDALRRFFWAVLGFSIAGIGYWWQLFDRQHLCLHDRISRTRVIFQPPQRGLFQATPQSRSSVKV